MENLGATQLKRGGKEEQSMEKLIKHPKKQKKITRLYFILD